MPAASFNRRLTVKAPGRFNFRRAVQGHGWFDLPPFHWSAAKASLSRALDLPSAGPSAVRITAASLPGGREVLRVTVTASRPPEKADLIRVARDVSHMLRLDEDLEEFYRVASRVARPDLRWTASAGAGRLLRAPAVFEDLVKMICTTNCTWALTRVMVTSLVSRLGREAPGGERLFPDPEAMAAEPPRFYRDAIRAGYRGPFLRSLARDVSRGALCPERWSDPGRPTEAIRQEILSIEGAGPYVADNVLKLLGRYDGLGIDAWCRRKFSQMYNRSRTATDRRIERFYQPFGKWRGLALWCDMTRDWFVGDKPGPKELGGDGS